MIKSLNFKLTVILFLIFGSVIFLGGLSIFHVLQKEMTQLLSRRMTAISSSIAAEFSGSIAEYLVEAEPGSQFLKTAERRLEKKRDMFSLVSITLLDTSGRVLVSTEKSLPYRSSFKNESDTAFSGEYRSNKMFATPVYRKNKLPCMSVYVPLTGGSGTVNAVMAVEASADYFRILNRFSRFLVIAGFLLISVTLIFSYVVSRFITRPIKLLSETASRIGKGELGLLVSVSREDEIGTLSRAINDMSRQLKLERRMVDGKIASLTVLAGGVAHEIRNPLNGINLYVDLLERKAIEPGLIDTCRKIKSEIKAIDTIIAHLLDYTKPLEIRKQAHPFKLFADKSRMRLLPFEFKTSFDSSLYIVVDEIRFQQVLDNLLRNAFEEAGMTGIVLLEAFTQEGKIILKIHNTGRRIAEEDRHRLFDPFFTTKPSGTGLGLAVSRKIIEAHGGTLDLEDSENGHFATAAVIRLP